MLLLKKLLEIWLDKILNQLKRSLRAYPFAHLAFDTGSDICCTNLKQQGEK